MDSDLKPCPMCGRQVEARAGALVDHLARGRVLCPGSRTPVREAEAITNEHRGIRERFRRPGARRPAHAMARKAGG